VIYTVLAPIVQLVVVIRCNKGRDVTVIKAKVKGHVIVVYVMKAYDEAEV
jgi:hypothetical protein